MSDHPPLPTPEAPIGTSSKVSMHPRPPETNTQPLIDSAAPEVPPDKLNRSKRGKVPSAKWEEHKDTLYNLYIAQRLTLEKTMAFMDKHHDFQASKTMYKERFKSWRMFKKLRKVGVNKEVARQLKELDSNYTRRVHSNENQHYRAASDANDTGSPMTTETTAEKAPTEKAAEENVPRVVFIGPEVKVSFDVQVLCADVKALSMDELLMVQTEALRQISYGQLDRAILMLRTAIARRKDIYKSSHPTIVAALWHLVDAYALNQDFQHADEVVDRISTDYSRELGLWHPRTLDHYQRVVINLKTSGRNNVTRSLGFLLFTVIRDNLPPTDIISVRPAVVTNHDFSSVTESPEFQGIFSEHLDVNQMDQQLRLAAIWSLAKLPGMQLVVQKLISDFKLLPLDLRGREVEARCIYIYSLVDEKTLKTARSECLTTRHTLTSLILCADPLHLTELIPLARELQYQHRFVKDTSGRNAIGRWIADLIQDGILQPFRGIYGQSRSMKLILHFTAIGLGFQQLLKQKEALFRFEFARKVSDNLLGSDHSISQRLDRAIKDQYYDDNEPFKGL
ncbi:hypothetical protein B0J15DRAFT_471977 [Fusarium solani]|uniref:Clr5 domain-containing protein n=1 Tax=Fusarium solani TaxID=169388 RepID=A0A9P9GA51_FUSSL|nr:uncharacterized protein B0J15DRAFT_471977 [Fusarium solani]KAH7234099.1 hypothetical protein B0J15DRAFT_471977 [Fusarium solani]